MRIRGTVLEFVWRTEDKSQKPSVRRADCVYTSGGDVVLALGGQFALREIFPGKYLLELVHE